MTAPLRIAILYGAESYQAYHLSDIAAVISRDPTVDLTILTVDPAIDAVLARLEAGVFARAIPHERLHAPLFTRILRRARIFGLLKQQVLASPANLRRLAQFDAIVTSTTHLALVRDRVPRTTLFIHCDHGAGGRQESFSRSMAEFDLLIATGPAVVERFVADGLATAATAIAVGLVKLETCNRLATEHPPLFDNDAPIVVFNSHSKRRLRSWEKFADPLIEHAARTGEFNLIVAPHVKHFARRPRWVWRRWQKKAVPGRVHIDLGSEASIDMRYTLAADIYAGDVSSQVYEFLTEPKPCLFLNAHGAAWQGSPDYPMWRLGEVADTPEQAIALIRRAFDIHPRFAELQARERDARIGTRQTGMAAAAAEAILRFLRGAD